MCRGLETEKALSGRRFKASRNLTFERDGSDSDEGTKQEAINKLLSYETSLKQQQKVFRLARSEERCLQRMRQSNAFLFRSMAPPI